MESTRYNCGGQIAHGDCVYLSNDVFPEDSPHHNKFCPRATDAIVELFERIKKLDDEFDIKEITSHCEDINIPSNATISSIFEILITKICSLSQEVAGLRRLVESMNNTPTTGTLPENPCE